MKELYQALAKAQRAALGIAKDKRNDVIGMDYTSAELIVADSKRVLLEHGLMAIRKGWTWEKSEGDPAPCVRVVMKLVHMETGECADWETVLPAPPHKGMPEDKAALAALTSAQAYWLLGILQIPRGMEINEINDVGYDPQEAVVNDILAKAAAAGSVEAVRDLWREAQSKLIRHPDYLNRAQQGLMDQSSLLKNPESVKQVAEQKTAESQKAPEPEKAPEMKAEPVTNEPEKATEEEERVLPQGAEESGKKMVSLETGEEVYVSANGVIWDPEIHSSGMQQIGGKWRKRRGVSQQDRNKAERRVDDDGTVIWHKSGRPVSPEMTCEDYRIDGPGPIGKPPAAPVVSELYDEVTAEELGIPGDDDMEEETEDSFDWGGDS